MAGYTYNHTDYDFALARYNADGSLDTTFGADGMVTTDFFDASYDSANALALQIDGKIVVAGSSDSDFALARYLGDAEEAEPVLSVSPRALNFGRVEVDTTADKSFTVENTGGGALTGNATTAAPFSIVEGSPFSLGEGQSQEVVARFSPSSKVFSLGTVSVSSDGGNASVGLIGKGK